MKKSEFLELIRLDLEKFEKSWRDIDSSINDLDEFEWWEKFFNFIAETNQEPN